MKNKKWLLVGAVVLIVFLIMRNRKTNTANVQENRTCDPYKEVCMALPQ